MWEQPKSDDFWRLCNHLITPVTQLDHTCHVLLVSKNGVNMHKFAKDVEPEQDFGEKWYSWLMIRAVCQKQFCPTRSVIPTKGLERCWVSSF